MISEIFGLLSSMDSSVKSTGKQFKFNLNKNRIRSISAFSSNSIFYFPNIVSDQCTPEEIAMINRMLEKSYASFVVACISLMPFHRISADDKASIEDYLAQFHQNLGMDQGSSQTMNRLFTYIDSMEESAGFDPEAYRLTQDFLEECWKKSLAENTDFVSVIAETVSLNDMYNVDAIDPKTRVLQARYRSIMEESNTWGFIGEATSDLFDLDDQEESKSDADIEQSVSNEYQDDIDLTPPKQDPDVPDASLNEFSQTQNENTVKQAMDAIKFSLESVSENKILSCQSLTKLASLEAKLNKLKNKYTKYLNRYKRKYEENKRKGSKSKLSIRLNNIQISNPKAFMKQYGTYIKLINKRLKLIEKRRAELRKRKGLPADSGKKDEGLKLEENVITDLTQMDFDALDHCDQVITESLNAPDSEIFMETPLDEASRRQLEDERDDARDIAYQERKRAEEAEAKGKEWQGKYIDTKKDYYRTKNLAQNLHKSARDQKEKSQKLAMENEKLRRQLKDKNSNADPDEVKTGVNQGRYQSDEFGKPQNNVIPSQMHQREVKVFDREVFTDMDMKKANEAIPIFTKATISFIVDGTEEIVSRDVLIGIKAYVHKAPAKELVDDVYNCIINKRKFLKFVKFVTGEERSLSDLLFGIKELRADALDAKTSSGEWRSAFKRRRRWAKMSIPYLTKEYTPNGTIVMTMNEVQYIKDQYGIDIMTPDHVRMIMDADYLLGFVIVDQANEMVYVTYDGHGYGFQQYTYAMLEREQQNSDRMMRELYRSFAH